MIQDLILFGPPGAGKGTQGALLADRFQLLRLSTGDVLRDAVRHGTDMGLQARRYMDAGELVPDEVILGIVRDYLRGDCGGAGRHLRRLPAYARTGARPRPSADRTRTAAEGRARARRG
jgi:adenylate kinase